MSAPSTSLAVGADGCARRGEASRRFGTSPIRPLGAPSSCPACAACHKDYPDHGLFGENGAVKEGWALTRPAGGYSIATTSRVCTDTCPFAHTTIGMEMMSRPSDILPGEAIRASCRARKGLSATRRLACSRVTIDTAAVESERQDHPRALLERRTQGRRCAGDRAGPPNFPQADCDAPRMQPIQSVTCIASFQPLRRTVPEVGPGAISTVRRSRLRGALWSAGRDSRRSASVPHSAGRELDRPPAGRSHRVPARREPRAARSSLGAERGRHPAVTGKADPVGTRLHVRGPFSSIGAPGPIAHVQPGPDYCGGERGAHVDTPAPRITPTSAPTSGT